MQAESRETAYKRRSARPKYELERGRLVRARSDQPDRIDKGGNRVTHLNSPSLAQAGGCGSPVVLEVVIVGVIRISGIIAIARAVRVRLPIGDRIVRLGPGRSGGSAATDQEVPSTHTHAFTPGV
jgi:hypothetical protein